VRCCASAGRARSTIQTVDPVTRVSSGRATASEAHRHMRLPSSPRTGTSTRPSAVSSSSLVATATWSGLSNPAAMYTRYPSNVAARSDGALPTSCFRLPSPGVVASASGHRSSLRRCSDTWCTSQPGSDSPDQVAVATKLL